MTRYRLLLAILFIAANAFGQNQQIDTDRPDQTETPSTVPPNRFQLENGFTYKHSPDQDKHRFELPNSLWKFGLSNGLELRLITNMVSEKTPERVQAGIEPVVVGAKVKLYKGRHGLPDVSVIGQLLLPDTPDKELSLPHIGPEVRLLFENKITESVDLGYNTGVFWDGESTKTQYAYTFAPCLEIGRKLNVYVESYGFLKTSRHPEHWIDGGLMLLVSKDVQVDVSAGYELTSPVGHRHGTFESIGVSFRI